MHTHCLTLVALLAASTLLSCATDEKGASCGFLDAYSDGENTYCPDETAPADCQVFIDTMIRRATDCSDDAGGLFTEADLRAAVEADQPIDCEDAVATTTTFDTCIDDLEDPAFCNADGSFNKSDACGGAILTHS